MTKCNGFLEHGTPSNILPSFVAGVDCWYDKSSEHMVGAAVVVSTKGLELVDLSFSQGRAENSYVPGDLFSREGQVSLKAVDGLARRPGLLICDGHGKAHPQGNGLACRLGRILDVPTVGVGKTCLTGGYDPPGKRRGSWSPLVREGSVIGAVLRTRENVRPVYVSQGHAIGLLRAIDSVLAVTPRYRLPRTTRLAHRAAAAYGTSLIAGKRENREKLLDSLQRTLQ